MVDPLTYRRAMGRLATGVTVLATGGPHGHEVMTANAVMSVSLEPVLLAVSVRHDCRWLAAARSTGRFTVSVLSTAQEELSRWCAGSRRHAARDAVLAYPHRLTAEGLLVFAESLAVFDCALHAAHEAGDHTLLVGRVDDLFVRDAGEPLLFFESDYRRVAQRSELEPPSGERLAHAVAG